jgi:hypothetical protein
MGKHETGYARVPRDAYTTPSWCIDALAEHVQLEGRKIWECAANSGRMVRALQAQGAKVFASDIDPHPGLDAVFDFLSPCLSPEIPAWDGIITNPPWGARNRLAEAFIRKGFDHLNNNGGFLALLLPTDFDSAVSRLPLFCDQRFTARISLTARPVWFKRTDGLREAPKENVAWLVWSRPVLRHPGPPLAFHAVARPNKEAGNELDPDATPTATVIDVSTPLYDSETDIWRGVSEAYQTIRRRQAAGGSGWNPLEKRKSST